MSALELEIGRIGIRLQGVSQEIAEEALSKLEGELARRIDALGPQVSGLATADLAEVALGPLIVPVGIDPAGLRSLIADALVGHVLDAYIAPQADEDGASDPGGG
jgi:hypothetical protein